TGAVRVRRWRPGIDVAGWHGWFLWDLLVAERRARSARLWNVSYSFYSTLALPHRRRGSGGSPSLVSREPPSTPRQQVRAAQKHLLARRARGGRAGGSRLTSGTGLSPSGIKLFVLN